MYKILATLTCVLLSVSAVSLRSTEVNTILMQLDSLPLGNAILSTIHLQMMAGEPLDEIVDLLNFVRDDLHEQQNQADALNVTQQAECDENLRIFYEEKADAEASIEENTNILARDRPELEATQSEIVSVTAEIEGYRNELASAETARAAQRDMWYGYDGEFDGAVEAIDECIDIIAQLKTDDSTENVTFLQKRLETLTSTMLVAMNKKQKSLYGPTIFSLAQLAMTADQGAVDQILDLLYRLKDEFALAQNYDQDAEDAAVIAHNEYVTSMNATIADRESHLEDLREKEANLQDSIAAAEQGLADAEAKRELYINLIAEQQQLCEDRRQLYFRETDERNEELDVVDQVNTIVNDRMLGMDPYLEERVNV